jgi:hypothetical protein
VTIFRLRRSTLRLRRQVAELQVRVRELERRLNDNGGPIDGSGGRHAAGDGHGTTKGVRPQVAARSIGAALRDLVILIDQRVESSITFRAIRWRFEAFLKGVPYKTVVLKRSMLYAVRHIFLIDRKSGILLLETSSEGQVLKDSDMISGMLTAILDFVSDSFAEDGQALETFEAGQFTIYLQHGSRAILAAVVTGTPPGPELRERFQSAMDSIDRIVFSKLDWNAESQFADLEGARPFLEECLVGQQKEEF